MSEKYARPLVRFLSSPPLSCSLILSLSLSLTAKDGATVEAESNCKGWCEASSNFVEVVDGERLLAQSWALGIARKGRLGISTPFFSLGLRRVRKASVFRRLKLQASPSRV
eukprot:6182098-Pleurochrysis_carterae.AAC.1